ncbi:MAG: hypothetical protein GX087_12350 [Desulfobulbaceae bacterium]|nr:hypothetical protein [Desulfobulbaceae bacterium]
MNKAIGFTLLLALFLSGCSGVRIGSSFTGAVPEIAAHGISKDAAERMAELYPPGHTSLYLTHPAEGNRQSGSVAFGNSFENNLRSKGFRIAPSIGSATPQVSWTVDALGDADPPSWYLQLKVLDESGARTISRVYDGQGVPQGGYAEGRIE